MANLFLAALSTTVSAIAKIVLICAGGAYLEKRGILNKEMRKGVSEIFVNLLLPCLLFTSILPSISWETLPTLAWLAAANVVYVSLGLFIGFLSVLLCRPKSQALQNILMATPAIGHANSIPFMLVSLIVAQEPVFQEHVTRAQGYVGLYLIMHSVTLWGVGLKVISKEKQEDPVEVTPSVIGREMEQLPLPTPIMEKQVHWMDYVPGWLNPPLATILITGLLAFIPGVQHCFTAGALQSAFNAMSALGRAGPSISLLSLGALFVCDGLPRPSLVGYAPLSALILGRLVILPACCIGLWFTLSRNLSWFPNDPTLILVMCIECCTPTAYGLVTMCLIKGINADQLTAGLFYQSIAAIFAVTAWCTIIVYYVV